MNDVPAGFRELKGFGPATEARLHDAGVYTWEALHEVVDALAGVRGGTGEPLRMLADQLALRAQEAGRPPRAGDGEQVEAFVVRIAMAADGTPARSVATHVRSQDEQAWPGWSPGEVNRFVEEHAGLGATPLTGAAPARDSALLVDGGTMVGGRPRTIDLAVPAPAGPYRAMLDEREYGSTAWSPVAGTTGRSPATGELRLRFPDVALPAGVRRLRVRLRVAEAP